MSLIIISIIFFAILFVIAYMKRKNAMNRRIDFDEKMQKVRELRVAGNTGKASVKFKWEAMLNEVDFVLAGKVLENSFNRSQFVIVKRELNDFISNPCFETAVAILEFFPEFIEILENCKPGGLYPTLVKEGTF